jgi:aspartate 1-decarboxylase
MDAANLIEGEKVQVLNINNGERLDTYVITGERGSCDICLNGPASRKVLAGDVIIIISYASMDFEEAKSFKPTIIDCDPVSNERFFVLSDPILTQNVIKKYKQVLLNDEGSLSMFDCIEFMFTKDIPDKAVNPKKLIDIVLDALFDIFPPPYL